MLIPVLAPGLVRRLLVGMVERLIDPARHHEHAGRAQRLPEHPMSSFARGMPEYSVTNAPTDFSQAKSMTDIGRKLLQSVGFASPDDASISLAIEANDAFVARLEAIRAAADSTIDQDDLATSPAKAKAPKSRPRMR